MSFLNGLAKGLHRAFDGNGIAATQAILAGDYQTAAAIRARQEELQRRNAIRDAQVSAAKDLGIGGDVSAALNNDDLSMVARQRLIARMYDPELGGLGKGEGDDDGPPLAPDVGKSLYALPPGSPPRDPTFQSASGRYGGSPAFGVGAPQPGGCLQAAAFPGAGGPQLAALGNIPRVQSHAHAAALPRGSYFLAPDASLRRII